MRENIIVNNEITNSERYIHTPGVFAQKNLLYIQEVGKLTSLKQHKCIREGLDSFLCMIVIDGEGYLQVENTDYSVKKGDVAFIDCSKYYIHESNINNQWTLMWVHFNGNSAKAMYELFIKANKTCVLKNQMITDYTTLIYSLIAVSEDKSIRGELMANQILYELMTLLLGSSEAINQNDIIAKLNDCREYINGFFAYEDVLSKIDTKLDKEFTNAFGISMEEYVNNRRINAAKELLRFTVKSIEDIAVESGLKNADYMCQIFVKKEGITPEEYRAKWAQWIRV